MSGTDDPFGSTQWSVVLAAGGQDSDARTTLATLCESYRLPVYGYVRSRVRTSDDAADRTQAFLLICWNNVRLRKPIPHVVASERS